MEGTDKETVTRIKKVRLSKGLLQKEVGIKSGAGVSLYNKIEKGNHIPSLKTAVAICEALEEYDLNIFIEDERYHKGE